MEIQSGRWISSFSFHFEGSKLMNKDGLTQSSQCDLEELSGLVPWIGLGNLSIGDKLSSGLPSHLQSLRCPTLHIYRELSLREFGSSSLSGPQLTYESPIGVVSSMTWMNT